MPINLLSIDPRCDGANEIKDNDLLSKYFSDFAESYLHAGDLIFKHYMLLIKNCDNPNTFPIYGLNMPGVFYRLYFHAIEMKLKSLVFAAEQKKEGKQIKVGHEYGKLIPIIQENYVFIGKTDAGYVGYIYKLESFSNGSQTGRYPTDSKGKIIGKEDNNGVVYNTGIATMVYHIHELFTDYFPNLILK